MLCSLSLENTVYIALCPQRLAFDMEGREYQAIEQNAEKPSRWGQLAREGHQVVQFMDLGTSKFVAVAVDGKVMMYGAGHRARKQ